MTSFALRYNAKNKPHSLLIFKTSGQRNKFLASNEADNLNAEQVDGKSARSMMLGEREERYCKTTNVVYSQAHIY